MWLNALCYYGGYVKYMCWGYVQLKEISLLLPYETRKHWIINMIILGCKCVLLTPITFTKKVFGRSISYYYRNVVHVLQRSPTKFLNGTSGSALTYARNLNPKTFVSTSSLEVNTKVIKDVILYRYENQKFFRIVNIFALCQFGFWTYLSHFAFTTLKDAPVPKDADSLPWWRRINLGENKYRNTLTVLSFLIGKLYL